MGPVVLPVGGWCNRQWLVFSKSQTHQIDQAWNLVALTSWMETASQLGEHVRIDSP